MYRGIIEDIKPYIGSKGGYGSTQTPHADFASMLTRLDVYVGQINEELKELGIEKSSGTCWKLEGNKTQLRKKKQ